MVNAAHPQKNKDDAPMISEEQHIKNIDKQVSLASDKPEPTEYLTVIGEIANFPSSTDSGLFGGSCSCFFTVSRDSDISISGFLCIPGTELSRVQRFCGRVF